MRNFREQQQVLEELILLRMLHATAVTEVAPLFPHSRLTVILDALDRLYRGPVLPVGPAVPDDLDERC